MLVSYGFLVWTFLEVVWKIITMLCAALPFNLQFTFQFTRLDWFESFIINYSNERILMHSLRQNFRKENTAVIWLINKKNMVSYKVLQMNDKKNKSYTQGCSAMTTNSFNCKENVCCLLSYCVGLSN